MIVINDGTRDRQTGECLIARWMRGTAARAAAKATRLAGEIVAAVAAGAELPEEWHQVDTYADMGEPVSEEVARLVRDELLTTGIRV